MTDTLKDTMSDLNPDFSRRTFIQASAGALVVFTLQSNMKSSVAHAAGGTNQVNGTIAIDADNNIVVTYPIAEMGQGTMTGLAQCVAEEARADWSKVTTVAADWQHSGFTGGSFGLRGNMYSMRMAGAQAYDMLRQAAEDHFGTSSIWPTLANGFTNGSTTALYKDLASAASAKTPNPSPTLVPRADWRLIGQGLERLDIPSKVDGSAVFGLDVQLPGMVYAAVRQCPTIGGTVGTTPSKPTGALAVMRLKNAADQYTAVALVANNSWMCINYTSAAKTTAAKSWRDGIKWTLPSGYTQMTSSTISSAARTLMGSATTTLLAENVGNAVSDYTSASKKFEGTYEIPYLVHTMMEVPNCTVKLSADSIEVWAPTQNPGEWIGGAAAMIKKRLPALANDKIKINATLVGGGFGRKFDHDFLDQAVQVAIGLRAQGITSPVKLFWPRTEDFSHDQYRPMGLMRVRIGMNSSGTPTSYFMRHVSPSPLFQRGLSSGAEGDNVDGAIGTPYAISNKRVEYVRLENKVPVGWWRSVGEGMNVFPVESAIDEAAALAGIDPVEFRRQMLVGNDAVLAVLNEAASMINWTTPVAGRGKGIALSTGFGSNAAVAVEVSQPTAGVMKIERIAVCVDPHIAVNPQQIRAQMEGGVIMGISSARWGKVTFSSGKANSLNFDSVRVARFQDVPPIDISILESGFNPDGSVGGVGEVGVPAVAPALANAWFRLTGVRKRTLPLG